MTVPAKREARRLGPAERAAYRSPGRGAEARRLINPTYVEGSIVHLRSPTGPGPRLVVEAPDGSRFSLVAPKGIYDLWVPQVGYWEFSWTGTNLVQKIEVIAAAQVSPPLIMIRASDLPPMQATPRPRR